MRGVIARTTGPRSVVVDFGTAPDYTLAALSRNSGGGWGIEGDIVAYVDRTASTMEYVVDRCFFP